MTARNGAGGPSSAGPPPGRVRPGEHAIASNVVDTYSWLATRRHEDRIRSLPGSLLEGPRLLTLDRKDRGDFLRHFYRRYEGAPVRTALRHDEVRGCSPDPGADQVVSGRDPQGA